MAPFKGLPEYDHFQVNFALAYPFVRPIEEFAYYRGTCLPLTNSSLHEGLYGWRVRRGAHEVRLGEFLASYGEKAPAFSDLCPVLAVGSNASPIQLARKYGVDSPVLIPCFRAKVPGWTIQYCAQIAAYGSVPTTISADDDVENEMWVTFLDQRAAERMDHTETIGHYYEHVDIAKITIPSLGGEAMQAVAYRSATGMLQLAFPGQQFSSPDIRSADQWAAQSHVIDLLGLPLSVPEFVWENISDDGVRLERERHLSDISVLA